MEATIYVEGMKCGHCKARVEQVCKAVPGNETVTIDLVAKTVAVTGTAPVEAYRQAIVQAGYQVVE